MSYIVVFFLFLPARKTPFTPIVATGHVDVNKRQTEDEDVSLELLVSGYTFHFKPYFS